MTVRAIYQRPGMESPKPIAQEHLAEAARERKGFLWVDIQGEASELVEPLLEDTFGFHLLAIEDALQHSHTPKIDAWDDYLYIVLHAVVADSSASLESTLEVDVFAGSRYVVTYQATATAAVERVWNMAAQSKMLLAKGPAHVLYRIIDEAEADFAPLFDAIDERISRIETEVFDNPTQELLADIFRLKRSILGLRRIMAPQREVIGKLARGGYDRFSPEEQMYFHDVYDHMVQLGDTLENLRDIVNGTLEIHLSAVSNRLNDVLKTLTIITTLFMPLTFIVGFFGMNFFQATREFLPWTGTVVFVLAIILMLATPLLMYTWIRRKGWV